MNHKLYQLPFRQDYIDHVSINTDWHEDTPLAGTRLDAIQDYHPYQSHKRLTYPTPFSQMYFFHEAFKYVLSEDFSGSKESIYHLTVSQCLDIWEILFYYDIYQPKGLNFKRLDFSKINKLKSIDSKKFGSLLDTLDYYLKYDNSPHIQSIDHIYLITYQGKAFAGTSPFTGFFATPREIEVDLKILNSRQYYFRQIRMLEERGGDFQRYLNTLAKTQGIQDYFNYFYHYINAIGNHNQKLKQTVWSNGSVNFDQDYPLTVENTSHEKLILCNNKQRGYESYDIVLRKYLPEITPNCSFFIRSAKLDKQVNADPKIKRPLVLITNPGEVSRIYVGEDYWNNEIQVSYPTQKTIEERRLPGYNIEYPWLTIDDFLEDHLIKVPYKIDDDYFITCQSLPEKDKFSFLLPIKPKYFDFFSVKEIQQNLKIYSKTDYVLVSLTIPIGSIERPYEHNSRVVGKDYLVLEKQYQITESGVNADHISAMKSIVTYPLNLILFPFFQTNLEVYNKFYKVGCIDGECQGKNLPKVNLRFYKPNGVIVKRRSVNSSEDFVKETRLEKKSSGQVGSDYYQVNTKFDAIQIQIEYANEIICGFIFPKWRLINVGNTPFTFSVDIDTFETQVSYITENHHGRVPPKSFDIQAHELQVVRMDKVANVHTTSETEKYDGSLVKTDSFLAKVIQRQHAEFIPSIVGEKYNFPIKTLITHTKYSQSTASLLSLANIPFAYGLEYDDYLSNETRFCSNILSLKTPKDENRLVVFIKEILLLIRNKILLNSGHPGQIQLYWLVKSNILKPTEYKKIQEIWNEQCRQVLGNNQFKPITFPHSVASFYLYQKRNSFRGNQVFNINLGARNTELAFIKHNEVQFITPLSFGENVFFSSYNNKVDVWDNGIFKILKAIIEEYLQQKGLSNEDYSNFMKWQQYLLDNGSVEGIFNFWINHPHVELKHFFNHHPDFKIPFLIFFCAICFHCTQIINAKSSEMLSNMPKDICFGGSFGKVLNLISVKQPTLEKIVNVIFSNNVNNYPEDHDLTVHILLDTPQSNEIIPSACNGVLLHHSHTENFFGFHQKEADPRIILGEKLDLPEDKVESQITYRDISEGKMNPEDSEYMRFMDLFLQVFDEIKLEEKLYISLSRAKFRELSRENATVFYNKGINSYLNNHERSTTILGDKIEEPIFFYGIIELIHEMFNQLAEAIISREEEDSSKPSPEDRQQKSLKKLKGGSNSFTSQKPLPLIFLAFANDQFHSLRKLIKERKAIKDILGFWNVQNRLIIKEESDISKDGMFDIFNSFHGRLSILHYGGHANSELLLLEGGTMPKGVLADLIRIENRENPGGIALVFLNGCLTKYHVRSLLDAGAQCVIGTQALVDDALATRFAERFYKALIKGMTLLSSFETAQLYITEEYQLNSNRIRWSFREDEIEDASSENLHWGIFSDNEANKNWKLFPQY